MTVKQSNDNSDLTQIPRDIEFHPFPEEIDNTDFSRNTVAELQELDPELLPIISKLKDGEKQDNFTIEEGNLYRLIQQEYIPGYEEHVPRLVIPKSLRKITMFSLHDYLLSGHLGYRRTLLRIKDRFWWPKMNKFIRFYVQSCKQCQMTKRNYVEIRSQMNPIPPPMEPFRLIAMDLITPLPTTANGNTAALVWTDYNTKWSEGIPIKDTSTETIAKCFLERIICRFGCPESVLTDLGTNFTAALMNEIYRLTGIQRLRTTAYHPQTNGVVERFNQTLKQMLKSYINQSQNN